MSCNKDSGCKELYSVTYPNLRSNINNGFNEVSKDASEVEKEINKLYIPDDYLGNKLQTKIDELLLNLNTNLELLSTEQSNVNTHIDEKIEEHQNHYNDYLASLEPASETEETSSDESEGDSNG